MEKIQLANELALFLRKIMGRPVNQTSTVTFILIGICIQFHDYMLKVEGAEIVKMLVNNTETKYSFKKKRSACHINY